jgi:hypothetical protein
MTQPYCRLIYLMLILLLFRSATAQTLEVIDAQSHATTFSAAQIAGMPHVKVNVRDHDADATFEGVPLSALLPLAGVQLGDSIRGPRMTEVLLVSATDGYRVAYALAEIDPAFAVREIILADKHDGKALDAKEGPFRIVAPGDKRPARWIRQVTELKVTTVK